MDSTGNREHFLLLLRLQLSNTFYEASSQWWFSLDSVSVVYNTSQEAVFNASEVYAPSSLSYHCSHVSSLERHSALLRPGSDNARRWTLTFTDFQVLFSFVTIILYKCTLHSVRY